MKITSNQVQDCILTRILHGDIQYINCPGSGRVGKLRTVVKENARTRETSALIAGKYQVILLALEILDKRLSCWVIPCEYLNSCRVAIGSR